MLTKGFKDNLSSWFEIAARHEGDLRITTWVPVRDDLRGADGALRLAALTFAVDSAVGMSAGFSALPNWVVTTDIDLRIFADARVGPVRTEAHTLRAGRSQVLAEPVSMTRARVTSSSVTPRRTTERCHQRTAHPSNSSP